MSGAVLVGQAMTRAWQEAIRNGKMAGMTPESVKTAASRVRNQMELEEAIKILGVDAKEAWPEVTKKFERMYDANSRKESFYLQSKIFRAYQRYGESVEQTVDEEAVKAAGYERQNAGTRGFAAGGAETSRVEGGEERTER